jgi:2-alkyl-3-oxoalkanoate reductase
MRVFVAGATGALGGHLVPGLIAARLQVTATTRTPGKVAQLRARSARSWWWSTGSTVRR